MNRLLAFGAAAAVAVGVGQAVTADESTTATVAKIVDGDTLDVTYDGQTHRVRLLNVDTPESVDPDEPVQCLGPEATEYLRGRLPIGTSVRLEFDEERLDQYDRELAGVFLGDSLVNADIAREGLGVAMSVAPNTRFLDEVSAAQAEAQTMGRGLYDIESDCTLPAQVMAVEAVAEAATQPAPPAGSGLEDLDAYAAELAAAATVAHALDDVLAGDVHVFPLVAFRARDLQLMEFRVDQVDQRVTRYQAVNQSARDAEVERIAAEEAAAEEAARKAAEEAARQAAEEAARRAAEERAAAQAAAESARRAAATSARSESASPAPSRPTAPTTGAGTSSGSADKPSGGGSDGYTGCRAYGSGGSSIDAKGRPYTKIDCSTKQPIG